MSDRFIPQAGPSRLRADNLTAGYDGPAILSDVTLAVADGKMTVLVGPNG